MRLKGKLELVVFDLDRTIVSDNCSFHFCKYLVAKKVLPLSSLFYSLLYSIKHTFFGMPLKELHESVFKRLLRGKSLEEIASHVEPFLQDYLPSRLYPPVFARLRLAQHLGHYTLILSNSPSFLVEKVAQLLGVNDWRSSHYATDREHHLSHIASVMQGEEKAECVKETAEKLGVSKDKITAYSDSYWDLPLLLSAGMPVAVNPDRKLRRFLRNRTGRFCRVQLKVVLGVELPLCVLCSLCG